MLCFSPFCRLIILIIRCNRAINSELIWIKDVIFSRKKKLKVLAIIISIWMVYKVHGPHVAYLASELQCSWNFFFSTILKCHSNFTDTFLGPSNQDILHFWKWISRVPYRPCLHHSVEIVDNKNPFNQTLYAEFIACNLGRLW